MADWSDELVKIGLGAVAGAGAGWFFSQFQITAWMTKKCFGPRLRLDVDGDAGSDVSVPLLNESGQPTGQAARYFRVKLENDRGRPAIGVRGFLTDIRRFNLNTKKYDSVGFCDTVPLNWSYRDNTPVPPAVEIPCGVKQFLDIVWLEQQPDGAITSGPVLCVSNLPIAYTSIVANGGKYLFRVLVQGESYIREEIGMIWEWSGEHDPVEIEVRPFRSFKSELA